MVVVPPGHEVLKRMVATLEVRIEVQSTADRPSREAGERFGTMVRNRPVA